MGPVQDPQGPALPLLQVLHSQLSPHWQLTPGRAICRLFTACLPHASPGGIGCGNSKTVVHLAYYREDRSGREMEDLHAADSSSCQSLKITETEWLLMARGTLFISYIPLRAIKG